MLTTVLSSLIIIVIIHYVYLFLRDSLTAPRVRDLVHIPTKKRDEILALGSSKLPSPPKRVEEETEMKAELGAFLKQIQGTPPPSLGTAI
tara:strand:- start:121 stop:390 length:270 start_codon:yes stop_codon:yes gene_type:complete